MAEWIMWDQYSRYLEFVAISIDQNKKKNSNELAKNDNEMDG